MWLTVPRLIGALAVFPVLCASAPGRAAAQDPNVITATELTRSGATNAYDAIHRLRPEMLRSREAGALSYFAVRRPVVAVDNAVVGGVDALRTMDIGRVARIESLSPWQAEKRYGATFGDGVVLITQRTDSTLQVGSK